MKHVVLAVVVLWAAVHFGGMLFSSHNRPNAAFDRLLDAPPRSIQNPYRNGYFYFFGLTAGSPLDPAKTGYEIWVEETEDLRHAESNRTENRADIVFALSPEAASPAWDADDPLNEFRNKNASFRAALSQYQILLSRYERWTAMPFDDWGFGRRVAPLSKDILAVHRLYVAEGFSWSTLQGLERLRKEFQLWRTVLREAKTIETKVFAQVIITDDLQLLSRMLSKPTVDKAILAMGMQLTLPLSASEYSLRWPVRHQLALATKDGASAGRQGPRRADHEWLANAAHLPVRAFDDIEHPPARAAAVAFQIGQASRTYAAYYEAIITASEANAKFLPRMQEVMGTVERGMIEIIVHPRPVEPAWEMFYGQLIETDARLRLASLQIQLRRPGLHTAVPTRLAEVGSQYFDPFTGLPMLWSPTQEKIYSVGKDRLDDGGDPTFDVSVLAAVQSTLKAANPSRPESRSTRRRVSTSR